MTDPAFEARLKALASAPKGGAQFVRWSKWPPRDGEYHAILVASALRLDQFKSTLEGTLLEFEGYTLANGKPGALVCFSVTNPGLAAQIAEAAQRDIVKPGGRLAFKHEAGQIVVLPVEDHAEPDVHE